MKNSKRCPAKSTHRFWIKSKPRLNLCVPHTKNLLDAGATLNYRTKITRLKSKLPPQCDFHLNNDYILYPDKQTDPDKPINWVLRKIDRPGRRRRNG